MERRCTRCEEWKPETIEFYYMHNKVLPEKGFHAMCKECTKAKSRKYLYDNLDIELEKKKIWKEENRDKNLEYMRKHYQNNKDSRREYVKDWINNNPEKAREYKKQHRNHDITDSEWKYCKMFFNNCCAYCGLPQSEHWIMRSDKTINMELHKEHVDDQGLNDLSNCVPSCQSCNSTKNIKSIDELLSSGLISDFNEIKYNKIIEWTKQKCYNYIEGRNEEQMG